MLTLNLPNGGGRQREKKKVASFQNSEAKPVRDFSPSQLRYLEQTFSRRQSQLPHSKIERGGNKRRAVRNPLGGEFKGLRSQTRRRRACIDSSAVSNSACTALKSSHGRGRSPPLKKHVYLLTLGWRFVQIEVGLCWERKMRRGIVVVLLPQ